jgi:hypothetical protein
MIMCSLEYDIGIVGRNIFDLNVQVNYLAYVETNLQSTVFCVLIRKAYSITTLAT